MTTRVACPRAVSCSAAAVAISIRWPRARSFTAPRPPLRKWFLALWLFLSSKRGLSALELGRQLQVATSTAWTWLQKVRSVLAERPREPLDGKVDIDETYIGGHDEGRPGRSLGKKRPAVAAVEGGAHEVLPSKHRVFALVRRMLLGTYQGAARLGDLHLYLAEFDFRFNGRSSRSRGLLVQRALDSFVVRRGPTLRSLTPDWRVAA